MARILIVDDEPDVRELFNITLKMAGHVTETAKHGLEAVDRLANLDMPELIVLDLMMPHLDGFGLLNHIRNELSTKPVRVLVATAKVLEDADQEKLGSWPVVGVLNKGELDIGQMVLIVSNALTQNPLKQAAAGEAKEEAKDSPAPKDAADKAPEAEKSAAPADKEPAAPSAAPAASTTPAPAAAPSPAPETKDGPPAATAKDEPSKPATTSS